MMTELIGGVFIGIVVDDWLGRLLLPAAVGLFACGRLFFMLRRDRWLSRLNDAMRQPGVSEDEIAESERILKEVSDATFREMGLIGWSLYARQFIWSTLTTLLLAIFTGLICDWLV